MTTSVVQAISDAYQEACDRRDYRLCDTLRALLQKNLTDDPEGTVMPLQPWIRVENRLGDPIDESEREGG